MVSGMPGANSSLEGIPRCPRRPHTSLPERDAFQRHRRDPAGISAIARVPRYAAQYQTSMPGSQWSWRRCRESCCPLCQRMYTKIPSSRTDQFGLGITALETFDEMYANIPFQCSIIVVSALSGQIPGVACAPRPR